jgi:hypothetical protein
MHARNAVGSAVVLAVLVALAACGGGRQTVIVPPRVDLAPYERVGLVMFTVENARGSIEEFATQRFAEHLLAAQWGYELFELAAPSEDEGGATRVDAESARQLAAEHGLPVVFVGHLVVSDVRPRATLAGGARIAADVNLHLTVRMLSGESGGTLWTQSARVRDTLAEVSLIGGVPEFGAQDPEEVYGALVNRLVFALTRDFRSTRRRL